MPQGWGRRSEPWNARVLWLLVFPSLAGAPLAAGVQGQKLNGPLVGDVFQYELTNDARHVVYVATQDAPFTSELYSTRIGPGFPNTKLSGPLVGEVDALFPFLATPDSSRVVYLADAFVVGRDELFIVPVDGSSPPALLSGDSGEYVEPDFRIGAGGSLVAYRALGAAERLRVVRTDAPGLPMTLAENQFFGGFEFVPDGSRVLYASRTLSASQRLYSVLSDACCGPAQLSTGFFDFGGEVLEFSISPDGTRALYIADQHMDDRFELFSVPVDGSEAPVKLNGPLVPGGDGIGYDFICGAGCVLHERGGDDYLYSPDSALVVYLADQEDQYKLELYRVPIDGSASPIKISGGHSVAYPFDSGERNWAIDPLGTRVVFRAYVGQKLYSVPIDGSAIPIELNGLIVPGGFVKDFRISASGTRVVYLAEQDTDNVLELYVVPIDGSASPVKLSGTLVAGGDVSSFTIEGNRVVYIADQEANDVSELFQVPLDGSAAPTKLNVPLVAAGDVVSFDLRFTRAVYRADQDTDEVFEVYLSSLPPLDRPIRQSSPPPVTVGP